MKLLFFLLLLFFVHACNLLSVDSPNALPVTSDDISSLNKKYSAEDINFFYETALHRDGVEDTPDQFISKWYQDVYLQVSGNILPGDKNMVDSVVAQLNKLQLPIHIYRTDKPAYANMYVRFGTPTQLGIKQESGYFHGRADTDSRKGVIYQANIYIVNHDLSWMTEEERAVQRAGTILEEISQALGIVGDSYAYPFSLFYEYYHDQTNLSDLDKRMLQLLYDPRMPAGYQRRQFEEDFSEVLCTVGDKPGFFRSECFYQSAEQYFLNYINTHNVSKATVERILQYGLVPQDTLERTARYLLPIPVVLHGDVTIQHIAAVREIIEIFNRTGRTLYLYLWKKEDLLGLSKINIQINFSKQSKQSNQPTTVLCKTRLKAGLMSSSFCRVGATIDVTYQEGKGLSKKITLALGQALYNSVVTDKIEEEIFSQKGNTLALKPAYAELLRTYYAPELINAMKKVHLENILEQMR